MGREVRWRGWLGEDIHGRDPEGRVSKGTGEQDREVRIRSSEKSGEREGIREERRLRIRLTCHHCLLSPNPYPRIPLHRQRTLELPRSCLPGPPEPLLEIMHSLLQEGGKQEPKKHQAAVWT